jgi:hypothetical protein
LQAVCSCCLRGVRAFVLAQVALLVRSVSPLALEEVLPVRSGLGSSAAALRALQQPGGSLKQPPLPAVLARSARQLLQGVPQYLEQLLEYLPPFNGVSTKYC